MPPPVTADEQLYTVKLQLVSQTAILFDKIEANNDSLDTKSWQITFVGIGVIAAFATFGNTLFIDNDISKLCFQIVCIAFGIALIFGALCVRGRTVTYVPGVEEGYVSSAENIVERYFLPDNGYLDVLLTDYYGTDEIVGAIDRLREINRQKARWLLCQLISAGVSVLTGIIALLA